MLDAQAEVNTAVIDQAIGSPRTDILHRPVRLVSAGRFVPKKGFLQAIEAIHLLVKQGQPLHYHLIGEGILLPDIQAAVYRYGLQKHILVEGKRVHPDLYHAFANADIFLASSQAVDGDREGIMTTVLEAMACYTAVVSTQHGGTPEVVTHGQTGYLTNGNTPQEIATALAFLLRNPPLLRTLRNQGAAYVRSSYSLFHRVDQLENVLSQIISSANTKGEFPL